MGFKINVNNILRYELDTPLEEEKEYSFEKNELSILADDIQIWLTKKDWTALAEILVTSQTRKDGKTIGTFILKHVYSPEESQVLTTIFKRMYGWK